MSDWADFCEFSGIDPNDPEEFDNLLEEYSNEIEQIERIILTNKTTGKKYTFKSLAYPFCPKCGGSGYLRIFKHNCNGRCFKCIPDHLWNQLIIGN